MTEVEKVTMNFENFRDKILVGMAGIFVTIFLSICGSVAVSLSNLNEKVYFMNEKMAVIIEKVAQHDAQLSAIINNEREERILRQQTK